MYSATKKESKTGFSRILAYVYSQNYHRLEVEICKQPSLIQAQLCVPCEFFGHHDYKGCAMHYLPDIVAKPFQWTKYVKVWLEI